MGGARWKLDPCSNLETLRSLGAYAYEHINNAGIYSSGGEFGGFVTLAGGENFIFTLAGVYSQMFYSSGGKLIFFYSRGGSFGKCFTPAGVFNAVSRRIISISRHLIQRYSLGRLRLGLGGATECRSRPKRGRPGRWRTTARRRTPRPRPRPRRARRREASRHFII